LDPKTPPLFPSNEGAPNPLVVLPARLKLKLVVVDGAPKELLPLPKLLNVGGALKGSPKVGVADAGTEGSLVVVEDADPYTKGDEGEGPK